jgi:toxin YoeB
MVRRINQLIKDIRRSPYEGIGKPEPLKHQLAGWWSRRIDAEHRFVYRATENAVEIAALRHHY